MDHACRLHKTASEKTLKYFIRHDQQGKGNLRQGGGDPGSKHLVGGVTSRTEGELTFQHNQRSEEYYLRGASKKAEKLKATDRTRQAERSFALVVTYGIAQSKKEQQQMAALPESMKDHSKHT
jgi:hypothetical protein